MRRATPQPRAAIIASPAKAANGVTSPVCAIPPPGLSGVGAGAGGTGGTGSGGLGPGGYGGSGGVGGTGGSGCS